MSAPASPRRPRDRNASILVCLGWLSAFAVLCPAAALLVFILWRGAPVLDFPLLFGSVDWRQAVLGARPVWDGIWPACAGTLCLIFLTLALACVPGIGCGVYLAEYAGPRGRRWLGGAIDMLAGVPSIVMGLFGFTLILFLRKTVLPTANACLLLAAGCLALLVLPSLAATTREAMLAVPFQVRLAAAALGLTPAQCVRRLLLPVAAPGITGGVILALGRAAEDTAVIMLTGVVANAGLPGGLTETFEAIPFSIFYTASQYRDGDELARGFGASLVLLLLSLVLFAAGTVAMNGYLRRWRAGRRP